MAHDAVALGQGDASGRCAGGPYRTQRRLVAMLPAAMARICHSCGKRPAFGQSRSHSMVATKRRFDANLQKVRIREAARRARVRLHALPEGRQGHQGRSRPGGAGRRLAASLAWPTPASSASAPSSSARWPSSRHGARRSTTSTSSRSPTATPATTWRSRCAPCSTSSTACPTQGDRRDRPRRDRRLGRPRGAARRARQLRRDPLPAHPRRGRGADLAARRAGRPGAGRRRDGARRRPRVRARCASRPRARSSPSCARWPRRIASEIAHMPEPRLHDASTPTRQDALIAEVLEAALRRRRAVGRARPRAAAGPARGRRRRRRRLRPDGDVRRRRSPRCAAPRRPSSTTTRRRASPTRSTSRSTYRYCTNFAVTGEGLDAGDVDRARSSALGDSVLVVGDQPHAQGPRPHRRARSARRRCSPSVGDGLAPRRRRHARAGRSERVERLAEPIDDAAACSPSSSGEGMARLFEASARAAATAAPTLNPSTYELLAGIHDVPAEEVVVLPNSPNVIMAAERAAELSEKKVARRPVALAAGRAGRRRRARPDRGAAANAAAMVEALAPRPHRRGHRGRARRRRARPARFHRGDAVGFIDERDRRLGRAGRDARGGARRARPRGRAADADRRATARRWTATRSRRSRRPASRWSTPTAASPATGG